MVSQTLATPILTALQACPDGMTAKEMAAELGWKVTKTSLLMGRMFFAGMLDRRGGAGPARKNNEYSYTIRPIPAVVAPRLVTNTIRIPRRSSSPAINYLAREADRLSDMETV